MARDEYEEEIDSDLLKEQLAAELDSARIDLRRAKYRVSHRLDVKTQSERFLREHRKALTIGASSVAGLVLLKFLLGGKKPKKSHEFTKASLVKSASGLVLGLIIKPYLRKWAMDKASDYISQRFSVASSKKSTESLRP